MGVNQDTFLWGDYHYVSMMELLLRQKLRADKRSEKEEITATWRNIRICRSIRKRQCEGDPTEQSWSSCLSREGETNEEVKGTDYQMLEQ